MSLHTKLIAAALCVSALPFAQVASAADFEDYGRVVRVTPQVEQINRPRQECRTEYVQVQQPPPQRGVGGAIIGGLIGGLLQSNREGASEKALFILGLLVAPLLWGLFKALPPIEFQSDWSGLILAGLFVGLGTRYGSGCTSGHGVCGISRLSPRSMLATACFMLSGFFTVFVLRHLTGV